MPQWLIILLTCAIALCQISVLIAAGWLAHRKGYRWSFWVFVGAGWLGLILLAFLPTANEPGVALKTQQQRQKWGNRVGAILTGLTYLAALWYRSNR